MLLGKLRLEDVIKNDELTNVSLVFVDSNNDEYEVKFNKLAYENGSYVESKEKEEKTEENLKKYLGFGYDEIENAIGQEHDVYAYFDTDRPYCSLWESGTNSDYKTYEKPNAAFNKKYKRGVDTEIISIYDSGLAIICDFEIDGKLYKAQNIIQEDGTESTMNYSKWDNTTRKWKTQGLKKHKALKIFRDELNEGKGMEGKKITVYPKQTNNGIYYLQFEMAHEIKSEQEDKWEL